MCGRCSCCCPFLFCISTHFFLHLFLLFYAEVVFLDVSSSPSTSPHVKCTQSYTYSFFYSTTRFIKNLQDCTTTKDHTFILSIIIIQFTQGRKKSWIKKSAFVSNTAQKTNSRRVSTWNKNKKIEKSASVVFLVSFFWLFLYSLSMPTYGLVIIVNRRKNKTKP